MSSEPTRPASTAGEQDDETRTLTDARAMRALAHPVRMALLELFSVHGTLTATQASEALGESPANCAFHLRTLAKYGFVHEAGGGRGRERPWAITNRSLNIESDQPDPQVKLAARELVRNYFERWVNRARPIFGANERLPGWGGGPSGWTTAVVYLTPEESARLREETRRMLHGYEERLTKPELRPEGALPVEWSIFVSPVPEWSGLSGPGQAAGPGAAGSAASDDPDSADSQ
jgi:predicted transcriptional regulator